MALLVGNHALKKDLGYVSLDWFNTKPNMPTGDWSVALTEALNYCIVNGLDLVVPNGIYYFSNSVTINANAKDVRIRSLVTKYEGFSSVKFYYSGTSTFLTLTNARNLYLEDIEVSGYLKGVDTNCYKVGSIGFSVQGSIVARRCNLNGFEKISVWAGGYYHKYLECTVQFTKIAFADYNANNLIFDKCKVSEIESFCTVNGGSGTTVARDCSFEKFTTRLFQTVSGATSSILLEGNYIENYTDITPPTGLVGTYTQATVISGFNNITFISNDVTTNGIKRVIFSSPVTKQVISLGNKIRTSTTNIGDLEFYIYNDSLENVLLNDIHSPVLTQIGTFSKVYLSKVSGLIHGSSQIYDCFTKLPITTSNTWTTLTPVNGWEQSAVSSHSTLSYRVEGKKVILKGVVRANLATDDLIVTLPASLKPTQTMYKPTCDSNGTKVILARLSTTDGGLRCTNRDSYVILDGFEYYID